MLINEIYNMNAGRARRSALMSYLDAPEVESTTPRRLTVNRKYCANLADLDLRNLMKKGLIVRGRDGSKKSRSTYVMSAKLHEENEMRRARCRNY